MLSSKRRDQIAQFVLTHRSATVNELVELVDASPATIRRDLGELEGLGMLRRIHGGAVAAEAKDASPAITPVGASVAPERTGSSGWKPIQPVDFRPSKPLTDELKRIALRARELIEPGETVLLDGGSTTYALAEALVEQPKPVTVITPSFRVGLRLLNVPGVTVFLTGGHLISPETSLSGWIAEEMLTHFTASKLFLGVMGISTRAGLAYSTLELAQLKRAMVNASQKVIVVCAGEKFRTASGASVIPVERVDTLITGRDAPQAEIEHLVAAGMDVMLV